MAAFRLPEKTRVGHVVLGVTSLAESLAFWKDLLGFRVERAEEGKAAFLFPQTGEEWVALLRADSRLPQASGCTGLYHLAVRLPSRKHLGSLLRRLADAGVPLEGLSDHGVSEALYLAAPDGLGVEWGDSPICLKGLTVAGETTPLQYGVSEDGLTLTVYRQGDDYTLARRQ